MIRLSLGEHSTPSFEGTRATGYPSPCAVPIILGVLYHSATIPRFLPVCSQPTLSERRWLLENRDEGCTESAVDGACWNGHEETVRWLMCEWRQAGSKRALDYAASTGWLEVQRVPDSILVLTDWFEEPGKIATRMACRI